MKKLLSILLVLLLLIVTIFSGCNVSYGIGSYEYNKIHVATHGYSGCIDIDKWYDTSTGLEVKTEDGQSMFFSEGTYILVEDDCPMCND